MAALVVGGGEEKQADDDYVTAQLERLLAEAGLESVPIDPTSLDALKELVADGTIGPSTSHDDEMDTEEDFQVVDNNNNNKTIPSTSMPSTTMMDSSSASLPMMAPRARDSLRVMEEASSKEFVAVEGASPVENQILEQLHLQTKLLVDMQKRIDDLTATVNHLTNNGVAPGTTTTYAAPVPNKYAALRTPHPSAGRIPLPLPPSLAHGRVPPTAPRAAAPVTPVVRPAAAPARGAPPPQPAVAAAPQPPQGMFHAITNSSILKIFVLFVKLRRRHVQELDGGLLFKILFMMAILSARMSSSSKKYGSSANGMEWHVKFACLVFLVLMGFLVQTGYVKYAHVFFVKENYPQRIWDGETVEDILQHPHGRRQAQQQQDGQQNGQQNPNAPLQQPQGNNGAHIPRGPPNNNPNQPPPRNNNNINNAQQQGGGGWRNTFLGGMIPDANPGGVVGVLQDVGLLLGSFLMSIFPMWHPEAPRRPPPVEPQQQEQPGGMAAPGQVAPPRDVLQPADDDDDDGVDL